MAAPRTISKEEGLGLGIALAAHLALFAFLALHEPTREPLPIPERMDVSLATDVGLTSTAPDAVAETQASVAPELSPVPVPPAAVPLPAPEPRPTRPVVQPEPPPIAKPTPKPTARATPKPQPSAKPTTQPAQRTSAQTPAKPSRATPAPTSTARPGGSRIGSDFLAGSGSSERSTSQGTVAAAFGPAEQASLESAINRQLKPHWSAPSGVDSELLVTVLSWELNPDGTLKGRPTVVSQSGINDSNRPQASLHAERAIRAVQLAAPFNLPDQFYDKWRRIRTWRFDRRL